MAYFLDHAGSFRIQEGAQPNTGMRRGQVGALFALAAHFIERHQPAIVCLPTGYGKTAVMAGTGFIARARRVLIITPTTALHSQAARAFRSLEALRRMGALPGENILAAPMVSTIDERITSEAQWRGLETFDVVVCTPHSASPEIEGVKPPPVDFFDLVLMDEGHHSPAATWSAFIAAIPKAQHVLFSATPFRRDRRQLPGRLVFYYSLRKASEENAFGKVTFCPVQVDDDALSETRDRALVTKAVEIFRRDEAQGLTHRLMARTSRIVEADRLANQYVAAGLRIESVSSRRSKQQVEGIERRLITGELDGVVCVDMFGEGYDFPKFKIAVLHSAHKALVPTLQFIGRFARTNDLQTGGATFIAVPGEVNSEGAELYREGVDWDVLLSDVVEARQRLSIQERETLQAFSQTAHPSADYDAVNPAAFRLGQHISAYRVGKTPVFDAPPEALKSLQVTNAWLGDDNCTYLLLAKSVRSPAWYRDDHLLDSAHECFLIKYFPDSQLLFITATERSQRYYAELLQFFVGGDARPLAFDQIRKVLNGLTDQEFYSVGIRSNSPTATTESYRIVAGSNADRGIRDSDASNFSQGHFMGRGAFEGTAEVIGASAGGRIWSTGKLSIPNLLNWMIAIHDRMISQQVNIGRSGLDRLSFGESLSRIPATTCMTDWPKDAYRVNPRVRFGEGNEAISTCILDLEIKEIQVNGDGSALTFRISDETQSARICYRLGQSPQYIRLDEETGHMRVESGDSHFPIEEWLEENSLTFFTKELDSFSHATLNRRRAGVALRPESLAPRDWTGCETLVEFDVNNPLRPTVQRFLQDILATNANASFLVYDHRSGEAADFIVGEDAPGGRLNVSLYHCKSAGGPASGERVDDVYELAGQAVKSVRFSNKNELLRHLERRTTVRAGRGHSRFLIGNRVDTLALIRARDPIAITLVVYAVQPGLSAASLAPNVQSVMAAANDSLTAQGCDLRWIVSA